MIVKAVRQGLGSLIVFVDRLARPKQVQRTPSEQEAAAAVARNLQLYQFHACPFCVKTRRAIHRLNIPIELRDAKNDPEHRTALRSGGGQIKVPCLRINEQGQTTWMYESSDIIAYLRQRFDPKLAGNDIVQEQSYSSPDS